MKISLALKDILNVPIFWFGVLKDIFLHNFAGAWTRQCTIRHSSRWRRLGDSKGAKQMALNWCGGQTAAFKPSDQNMETLKFCLTAKVIFTRGSIYEAS